MVSVAPRRAVASQIEGKLIGRSTRFRGAPLLLLKAQKPNLSAGDLKWRWDTCETLQCKEPIMLIRYAFHNLWDHSRR